MSAYKIMMIDDDAEDQWIVREALTDVNTEVMVAYVSNGAEALERLDRAYTADRHLPQLIILDLNMPLMNGTATLGKLKDDQRFRDIPVIIYSTSINPYEKARCMELGAHSYITKPISIEESIEIAKVFLSFCE